jgi:osmotically-inducible protein OsmY
MPAHFYLTGFRESDLAIERRVLAYLEQRQVSLEGLKIAVRGGSVILRGAVRSVREKSLAAEVARRVAGVKGVIDMLDVEERATARRPGSRMAAALQPI